LKVGKSYASHPRRTTALTLGSYEIVARGSGEASSGKPIFSRGKKNGGGEELILHWKSEARRNCCACISTSQDGGRIPQLGTMGGSRKRKQRLEKKRRSHAFKREEKKLKPDEERRAMKRPETTK